MFRLVIDGVDALWFRFEPQESHLIAARIGAVGVSERNSQYADVTDMFRHLQSLDQGSVAFRCHRDAIIEKALPIADHIARRFSNRGEPFDDLVQAARVGLLNAVNRFDVETGSDFLSFAVPTMMGEVRRHFRDHGWAVKVPRRLKDLQKQLVHARGELSQRLGRAPTASELADHLDIDRELVVQGLIAGSNYSTRSTDMQVGPAGESRSLGDTFGDLDPNLDSVINTETVRPLIASLSERQRDVLRLRFFENLTQTQIAERVGCSQMHVSRLIAQALRTLRSQVREADHLAATA
jgi:RNA polymerase sigma-B factor